MYKLMAIVCVLFLFFTPARGNAQRFHAFGGFSYSRYGANRFLPPRNALLGWNGSLELKVLPFLGIVADSTGHYGNETTAASQNLCLVLPPPAVYSCTQNVNASVYTFTGGPQVSFPLGRFRPYAHALFGAALYRELTVPSSVYSSSSISFADVFGGGIDVSIIPRVAWRVQADDLQTWPHGSFCVNGICGPSVQNSLRVSTGVVFGL
jgi:hypothetical protein